MSVNKKIVTKSDLLSNVASELKIGVNQAEKVVNSFIQNIVKSIGKNDEIRIHGFITMKKSLRKARVGTNPHTLEKIKIPSKNGISTKWHTPIKDAII